MTALAILAGPVIGLAAALSLPRVARSRHLNEGTLLIAAGIVLILMGGMP
jgi:hypothetical protein